MPISVTDARSNAPEQIIYAAECIGRSKQRLLVFKAIYFGSRKVKTAAQIANSSGLSKTRVLQEARNLVTKGIVHQEKVDGETAYRKDDFFHGNKGKILSLVKSPAKRQAVPTKRNPLGGKATVVVSLPRGFSFRSPKQLTIDDIDSFEKVRKVGAAGNLPAAVSETRFKRGLLRILCQGGRFRDWGGEQSDIYTSRLVYKKRRYAAAFALKGPGLKTRLTPGKMGKNGDQAQRLFNQAADFFVVQHWREIDPSVVALVRSLATAKALGGAKVFFTIIDGQDSMRLYSAYSNLF